MHVTHGGFLYFNHLNVLQITKSDTQVSEEPYAKTTTNESPSKTGAENHVLPTPGLRKRFAYVNML